MDDHNLFFTGYQKKIKKMLKFEVISFIGRIFSPKIRLSKNKYIQIGCGSSLKANFENIDFYPLKLKDINIKNKVSHDLRYPLPYKNKSFYGAFSEHTLEHLHFGDAINLLKEINRVLIPGSIFRCTVPDLKKYVNFYEKKDTNKFFEKFDSGAQAIWNLTQNYQHLSVWDFNLIKEKLLESGFKNPSEKKYLEGANKDIILDMEFRSPETLYVESCA
jgi:SAM-dependent methyltransferase|tara:strand:- start:24 stop:677 length:654 start_codon:yes stop_codon:yes gene_type:complete